MTVIQPTLPVLAAGVLVVALLSAALVVVGSRQTTPRAADRSGGDRGTVTCPACGTENGAGYRYCRRCVAELPSRSPHERRGPPAFGRPRR